MKVRSSLVSGIDMISPYWSYGYIDGKLPFIQ